MFYDQKFEQWEGLISEEKRTITDWLNDLDIYQRVYGPGSVPGKKHKPLGHVGLWIQRMRRLAVSGQLPVEIVYELGLRAISLDQERSSTTNSVRQETNSFEHNLLRLQDWIATNTPYPAEIANLTYAASRQTVAAKKLYTFVEHMSLKMRQRVLPDEHLQALCQLRLMINGKKVEDWLQPHQSLRKVDVLGLKQIDWSRVAPDCLPELIAQLSKMQCLLYRINSGVSRVTSVVAAGNQNYIELESGERYSFSSVRSIYSQTAMLLQICGQSPICDLSGVLVAKAINNPVHIEPAPQKKLRSGPDTGPGKPLKIGAKYGDLTVIARVARPPTAKHSGHYYRCLCCCGTEITLQRDYIVARDYPNCGCDNKRNLVGRVFGRLTVLNEKRRLLDGRRHTEWKVICSCGAVTWARASSLVSRKKRSCGCLRGAPFHSVENQQQSIPPLP